MTGAIWSALSGIGFGVFQATNRRAFSRTDVYRSTFILIGISGVLLTVIAVTTEDVGVLWAAPALSLTYFALAGLIHFFVGWTLLNASQARVGAARTVPIINTNPLFGTVIAAFTIQEVPGVLTIVGLLLMTAGVYVVASEPQPGTTRDNPGRSLDAAAEVDGGAGGDARAAVAPARLARTRSILAGSIFGLGAALSWAISPIFVRKGLEDLPSPLIGVSVSMLAAWAAYAAVLGLRARAPKGVWRTGAWGWKALTGLCVALATWFRWEGLDTTSVAVVLALSLLAVPTVMFLAPIVSGRHLERITPRLWIGAALVMSGGLLLILRP